MIKFKNFVINDDDISYIEELNDFSAPDQLNIKITFSHGGTLLLYKASMKDLLEVENIY